MNEVEHVGFTGTRIGLSSKQRHSLRIVLEHLKNDGAKWFHHGDCVGADEEAHEVAKALGFQIHLHPPVMPKLRAFCYSDYQEQPLQYMKRNQAIVDACSVLVACPQQFPYNPQPQRSGTWATVNKAFRKGIPRVIVYIDGTIEHK